MAIRALREAAGLKQFELAALMNIKPAPVSAWERGKANPRPEHLKKLAGILHCSADELLGLGRPGA